MCGFVGRVAFSGAAERPIDLAAPFVAGRGPDGFKIWRSKCGTVEILHSRLAIVDRDSRAAQPLVASDGRDILAFNGEVYNYQELKRDLRSHAFVTESDTEVLLAGLRAAGLGFLTKVRGMFSGVWFNQHTRRLTLFRDPVGKKPLILWIEETGDILFGSSVKALHAIRSTDGTVRTAALAEAFSQGYCGPRLGVFCGVQHLLPGEAIQIGIASKSLERATLNSTHSELNTLSKRQGPTETLRSLLDQAVSRRLHNNPEPAVLLSGGVDSTLVAEAAVRQTNQLGMRLRAYSLKPWLPATADQPFARFAARRLGLDVEWISLPSRHLADRVLESISSMDEPLPMISYLAQWELVRAVGRSSRVLLTGDGGDEVFCGYGVPQDWIAERTPQNSDGVSVGLFAPNWFSPWAKRCVGEDLFGHGFQKVDRSSAEQGVEVRSPLLDLDVILFARGLAPKDLFLGGRPKGLLKSLLKDWPTSFVDRKKIGMAYNLRWQWMLQNFNGLRENVSDEVHSALLTLLPEGLAKNPNRWSVKDILTDFPKAYSLLVISKCLDNLRHARKRTLDRVAQSDLGGHDSVLR